VSGETPVSESVIIASLNDSDATRHDLRPIFAYMLKPPKGCPSEESPSTRIGAN